LGAVQRDIYAREWEWHCTNLSTTKIIKALLKNRSKYDLLWGLDKNTYTMSKSYVYLNEIVEEVTCLYIYLDELVKEIKLNKKQQKLITMYQYGYTEEDLSLEFLVDKKIIHDILKTICKKIQKENESRWMNEFILWNKKKVETNYKQCTRCKKFISVDNFGKHNTTKDNLQPCCKKCDSDRRNNKI